MTEQEQDIDPLEKEQAEVVAEEQQRLNTSPDVMAAMVRHLQARAIELNLERRQQAARIVELENALRAAGRPRAEED